MILVTGGAGYIGSHYTLHELEKGGELVVLDDLSRGHRAAVPPSVLTVGSTCDTECLDRMFRDHDVDAVVHFAAFAYVGESVAAPERYYRNNVVGTLGLLEAMQRHDVKHLVFSSTCATYGVPDRVPIDEGHPLAPISPYGESKLFCERMMAAFASAHGIRYVALRYFNAAGAHPSGVIGESHDPETHLIPLVLQAAAGRRGPVAIYGTDYDTPDGTCVRDYVHVDDLAQAHALALDWLRGGHGSEVFNLGSERGHSVREVIDGCARVTGRPIAVAEAPRRPGDPPRLVGDATRARERLGWRPRTPELAAILETAWRWESARRF